MTTKQPDALRLADELDGPAKTPYWEAAAELRRLHAHVEALTAAARVGLEALENVAAAMPFPVADQAIRALRAALKGQA